MHLKRNIIQWIFIVVPTVLCVTIFSSAENSSDSEKDNNTDALYELNQIFPIFS